MDNLKVVEIRDGVTLKETKREIVDYLRKHKEAETFDIANDLRLDLRVTVKAGSPVIYFSTHPQADGLNGGSRRVRVKEVDAKATERFMWYAVVR